MKNKSSTFFSRSIEPLRPRGFEKVLDKPVVFGIIGVGYWGPNYARILSEFDDIRLRWFCDQDKNALKKINKKYPAIQLTTDINDILRDKEVNCVAIATSPQSHYELAKSCINNYKNVIVEKPFTLTSAQAKELVKIANKNKVTIAVDHTYLFNPAIKKLKEIVQNKDFGRVYYSYGLYNALGPIRREVSALWDLAVHFIYIINYILEKNPISVSAYGEVYLQNGIEDVAFSHFTYPNNIIFNLHTSWLDPVKTRKLVIVGSKKMVIFDDMSIEHKIQIFSKSAYVRKNQNFTNYNVMVHEGDMIAPKIENKEPLKEAIADFVSSVLLKRKPLVSGHDAEKTIKILEFAQTSISQNGKCVPIKLT